MKTTLYLLSVVICSTIATPVVERAVESEAAVEKESEPLFDLSFPSINFDDLNSRHMTEELDRINDEKESVAQEPLFKIEEHDFERAQGPQIEQDETVELQPIPGLNLEPQELTSYAMNWGEPDENEAKAGDKVDRELTVENVDWEGIGGPSADSEDSNESDSGPSLTEWNVPSGPFAEPESDGNDGNDGNYGGPAAGEPVNNYEDGAQEDDEDEEKVRRNKAEQRKQPTVRQ